MTVNEYLKKIEMYPKQVQQSMTETVEIWSNQACIAYFEYAAKKNGLNQAQIDFIIDSMEKAFSKYSVDEIEKEV